MANSFHSILRETKNALGKSVEVLEMTRMAQTDTRKTITDTRVMIDQSLRFLRATCSVIPRPDWEES